jgi:tetratricopeptide (TPR) repeat protein
VKRDNEKELAMQTPRFRLLAALVWVAALCGPAPAAEPESAEAYNNRGAARYVMSDLGGAIADFDAAIRLNPDFAEAYANRGAAKSAGGDVEGAAADFARAIELKPDFAAAWYNRANMRLDRGDPEGAVADYDRAVELGLVGVEVYYNRALAHEARGDLAAAVADYERALEIDPGLRRPAILKRRAKRSPSVPIAVAIGWGANAPPDRYVRV